MPWSQSTWQSSLNQFQFKYFVRLHSNENFAPTLRVFRLRECSYARFKAFAAALLALKEVFLFEFLSQSLCSLIEDFRLRSHAKSDVDSFRLISELLHDLSDSWEKVLDADIDSVAKLKKLFII